MAEPSRTTGHLTRLFTTLRSPFRGLTTPSLPTAVPGDTALVTGATSGIGRATAQTLVGLGFRVIGTSRNPASLRSTADTPDGVTLVPLDLGDPESVAALPGELARVGAGPGQDPVTVLVNNAGESQSGPLEELPGDALERLFRINVTGQVGVTQHLLPAMREQGRGRIVFVGSMLGSFPLAHRGSYGASKAAVKAFAFSARRELRPFGIGVSVMEPGAIDTGISQRRTVYIDRTGPYAAEFDTMLNRLDSNERNGVPAGKVAAVIAEAATTDRPRALYATGSGAAIAYPASRLLPRDVLHGLVARRHGI